MMPPAAPELSNDEHVLVSFSSDDAARHALACIATEGIPGELLRVRRRALAPVKPPRTLVFWVAAIAAVVGAAIAAILARTPWLVGPTVGVYSGVVGACFGRFFDYRRRQRFDRRRFLEQAKRYAVTCPESALTPHE